MDEFTIRSSRVNANSVGSAARTSSTTTNLTSNPPSNKPINYKTYICPGCSSHYDVVRRSFGFGGRVPLVLHCLHTICEECIRRLAFPNNKVVCRVCQEVTEVPLPSNSSELRLQSVLPPNHYLFGLILSSKQAGDGPRALTATGKMLAGGAASVDLLADVTDKCCFVSCKREATVRCVDCNDVYCTECNLMVHKSVPFLGTHRTKHLDGPKFSAELGKCPEHPFMDLEYYCTRCHVAACCYCFLEKHEGHERNHLSKLTDAEMLEFNLYKEKAKKILNQLCRTQKRVRTLNVSDTSEIELKLASYFANFHARLYKIEQNLRQKLAGDVIDRRELNKLATTVHSNINELRCLLADAEPSPTRKVNMKAILAKLKECEGIPCYLTSDGAVDLDVSLNFNPIPDNFEELFTIENPEKSKYSLVPYSEIPEKSKIEGNVTIIESETESDSSKISSSKSEVLSKSPTVPEIPMRKPPKPRYALNEEVFVTHIESVNKFYVQKRKLQEKFERMCLDIRRFLKNSSLVEFPKIGEIYLVLRVLNNTEDWCRGRIVEILGTNYRVFFVDYGNTCNVRKDKIRTISHLLMKQKPFAFQCKLHNPHHADWSKDAYLHMAQLLSNKTTFIKTKRTANGINEVILMVSTSNGLMTSVADLLMVTCEPAVEKDTFYVEKATLTTASAPAVSRARLFKNSRQFVIQEKISIVLTYVKDPNEIYAQIQAYAEDYKKMISTLNNIFRKLKSCIPEKGSCCVVEYKLPVFGEFHRAEILDINGKQKSADVKLVDLGHSVTLPWSNMRILPETISKLETQAIMFKLAHIEPLEGNSWPKDLNFDFLDEYIIEEAVLMIAVKQVEPLEVALFDCSRSTDICLNAVMVDKKLAKSTGPISTVIEWPRVKTEPSPKPEDTGFMFLKQTYLVGLDSEGEEESCIEGGLRQSVDVVRVESPDLIFIKFRSLCSAEEKLYRELQVNYLDEREEKSEWNLNDKCVVLDMEDKDYCRGLVKEVKDNRYTVYLYDKGKEITVKKNLMFVLKDYFRQYHTMVFRCHLANIKPAGDQASWSNMAIEFIKDIFDTQKFLFVRKVEEDKDENTRRDQSSMPVEIWYSKLITGSALEPSQKQFKSINKLLVKAGLAFRIKTKEIDDIEEVKAAMTESSNESKDDYKEGIKDTKMIEENQLNELKKPMQSSLGSLQSFDVISSGDSFCKVDRLEDQVDWNQLIQEEISEVVPVIDWLPPLKLTKLEFQAMVTCCDYDGILYLHEVEVEPYYREMESQIKEIFDKAEPPSEKVQWTAGQMCTINYEGFWYRGRVLEVKAKNQINVFMIDFGSDHDLESSSLHPKVVFTEVPAFASQVQLHNVYSRVGKWSEVEYNKLLNTVTEQVKVVIKDRVGSDLPLVEMYLDSGECLNDLIVKKCKNLTRLKSQIGIQVSESDNESDAMEMESDVDEDVEESPKKSESESTGCCSSEDNQCENKTTNTKKIKNTFNKEKSESNGEELNFRFVDIPKPNNIDDFTIQKIEMTLINAVSYHLVVLDVLGSCLPNREDYIKMAKDIQLSHKSQPLLEEIKVGVPCICPYKEDGLWYRAQVFDIENLVLGYVYVFYVDYGNINKVCYNELRKMKLEWFSIPVRNMFAALNVMMTAEKEDDKDAKELVLETLSKLEGKSVLVEIVNSSPLTVQLYDKETGKLCYQNLVDKDVLRVI